MNHALTGELFSDKLLIMLDLVWFGILSDLFINLAAGWFGAVFIVPLQSKRFRQLDWLILTVNLSLGILALIAAFELRRQI